MIYLKVAHLTKKGRQQVSPVHRPAHENTVPEGLIAGLSLALGISCRRIDVTSRSEREYLSRNIDIRVARRD